jgi:phosphatidyl-myo-inositol dimannoside synthase
MKICYFNSDFPPNLGGMSSVATNLADAAANSNKVNKVVVMAFNNLRSRREDKGKIEINAFKKHSLPVIFLLVFYYVFKYRKFDFFHATDLFPIGFFLVFIAGKIFRKKVFISVYGTDALSTKGLKITGFLKKVTLKNCDKIFTISKSSQNLIAQAYNLDDYHFTIIPPGPDLEIINSKPVDIRSSYGLEESDFVILTVGRLIKRKGVDDLIKAISLINDSSVKLMIVGEGEESNNLKNLVSELNLDTRVIFAGRVDRVADYYYSCDVFSMPSKYLKIDGDIEGLGLVYLEAQYFGLPVIGTRSGGIPEAMIEGETGFLVDENSPKDLAEKIQLFKSDQETYLMFKNKALDFVKNNFSWEVLIEKMIVEYQKQNRIIAILRIKNEIDTIDESLTKLSELVDEIIVLDNDSTDGTQNVYGNYSKIVEVLKTEEFNEGRDKIMLLEAAKKRNPDWIIFLDVDEIFENDFTRKTMEKYMLKKYDRINFRLCHFWLSKKKCRLFDKKYFLYSLQPLRCMWRNKSDVYFADKIIHNGDVRGNFKKTYFSPYRLKHFSLINRQNILNKIKLYQEVDKGERDYSHMHPDLKYFTYHFLEFNNHFSNYGFIIINKYLLHLMWLVAVLFLRFRNFIKKDENINSA